MSNYAVNEYSIKLHSYKIMNDYFCSTFQNWKLNKKYKESYIAHHGVYPQE